LICLLMILAPGLFSFAVLHELLYHVSLT
jgi:hypothetical protein